MRALSTVALLAVLAGCPKNESTTTSVDAASSAPAASVSQVTLAPLDTGTPAASASSTSTAPTPTLATPPAHSGVALKPAGDAGLPAIPTAITTSTAQATPAAQMQFKQCCAALHKQSQQQSPQAAQLAQAAAMCDGLAAAMAGAPAMPQLDQVKMLLQGVPMPPVCQGL